MLQLQNVCNDSAMAQKSEIYARVCYDFFLLPTSLISSSACAQALEKASAQYEIATILSPPQHHLARLSNLVFIINYLKKRQTSCYTNYNIVAVYKMSFRACAPNLSRLINNLMVYHTKPIENALRAFGFALWYLKALNKSHSIIFSVSEMKFFRCLFLAVFLLVSCMGKYILNACEGEGRVGSLLIDIYFYAKKYFHKFSTRINFMHSLKS